MGPLSSTKLNATGDVTTAPSRLYGIIVSGSGASATSSVTLKDSSTGSVLLVVNPGDEALGPTIVNMPAKSYIRFDNGIHATFAGAVDFVTFLYQI